MLKKNETGGERAGSGARHFETERSPADLPGHRPREGCHGVPRRRPPPTLRGYSPRVRQTDTVHAGPDGGPNPASARGASAETRTFRATLMILPQVHLRKPCYDFYFL